jgi:hypothetical protein
MRWPESHVVAPFARPDQRDGVIRAFLGEGLRVGDKCICITESAAPSKIMESTGIDVDGCIADRSLDLLRSADAYCPDGRVRSRELLDRWSEFFDDAIAGPPVFSHIRVAAEVSVATLRDRSGIDELFRSELASNSVFTKYPLRMVCLYDVHCFGRSLMTFLRTHPRLLVGDVVIANSAYVGSA